MKTSLIVKCDRCGRNFERKWVALHKKFSATNEVNYWTEGKNFHSYEWLCGPCLKKWYENEKDLFLSLISDKKKTIFYNYLRRGTFNGIKKENAIRNYNHSINSEKSNSKKELEEIIANNSHFISHIKDNIVVIPSLSKKENYEIYYTGQQGWSEKVWDRKKPQLHSGKKCKTKKEIRTYIDWVENIKSSCEFSISNHIDINNIIENKSVLLAIRFSKRLDAMLINEICQIDNFSSKSLIKVSGLTVKETIKWIISTGNQGQFIDINKKYDKNEPHDNFAIDFSDYLIIINQPLFDEIVLEIIFKKIEFPEYLKVNKLNIISHPLPNNFEVILINKRSLWCHYQLTSNQDKEKLKDNNQIYFAVSYEIGVIPFAGTYALIKAK